MDDKNDAECDFVLAAELVLSCDAKIALGASASSRYGTFSANTEKIY